MRLVPTGASAARAFLSARVAMWNARSTVLTTSVFFLANAGAANATAITAASSATTCDLFIDSAPACIRTRPFVPSLAHGVVVREMQAFSWSARMLRPVTWEPELEELRRREELARRMGGEERVERQHASGRMTVRERVERLFDEGSVSETGAVAGRGTYEEGELVDFLP